MSGQGSSGSAKADWYADPLGRHQFRYWDGQAWTDTVADDGQTSVDPLDAAGSETVLMTLPRVSDVAWGGSANVYLTDRRLVLEPVLGTGGSAGALVAGGVVGVMVARKHAENKRSQEGNGQVRTMDEVLLSTKNAYAISYSDITKMVLTRKALPVGCSRCKIRSGQKNVTLAFKREMFDQACVVLADMLPGKVTIR